MNPASHVNGESRVRCRWTSGANPTARLCQTRRSSRSISSTYQLSRSCEHRRGSGRAVSMRAADRVGRGARSLDPTGHVRRSGAAGFRVASASNGFSAVRLARREPLALVVLDLVLPEQSGLSVLAELKATPATARVPVIVVSGHPQALRDAVTQADAVIAKPFGTDTLRAEVSRSRRRAVKAAAHCDSCHTCAEGDRPVGSRRGS